MPSLSRKFEGVQGFARRAAGPVGGAIAEDADVVKKIGDLGWKQPLETQSAKQVGLRTRRRSEKVRSLRRSAGQAARQTAEFDEACIGVVVKIAFGERTQPHELNIVLLEEKEIARFCSHVR